jgi:hypothetical protein
VGCLCRLAHFKQLFDLLVEVVDIEKQLVAHEIMIVGCSVGLLLFFLTVAAQDGPLSVLRCTSSTHYFIVRFSVHRAWAWRLLFAVWAMGGRPSFLVTLANLLSYSHSMLLATSLDLPISLDSLQPNSIRTAIFSPLCCCTALCVHLSATYLAIRGEVGPFFVVIAAEHGVHTISKRFVACIVFEPSTCSEWG